MWIGVTYNSLTMTMAIDTDRVDEALAACREVMMASRITLHQAQKLIRKIFHASKCTVPA